MRQLKIALLCDFHDGVAGTILDHLKAFDRYSMHDFARIQCVGGVSDSLDLAAFDAVVIHYTLVACMDAYLSPVMRMKIRNFSGYKLAFVQDDYRFIDDTVLTMATMRIDALFGLAGPDIIDEVYSPWRLPGVRRETVLAGYVPGGLLNRTATPISKRPIDVGYRARRLPAWMGSHAQEKSVIADRFQGDAKRYALSNDLSCDEKDRMYGERWINFLSSCKAVLGTESGASICDFTGDIQRNVEAHVATEPSVTFETLRELYFRDVDGKVVMNVISPRCFEAICLRTLMIMYPGEYSGRLLPWRHYVPLNKDHSNMDEVVAVLRNPIRAQAIVDRAYEEVACAECNGYSALADQFDAVVADLVRGERHRRKPVSQRVANSTSGCRDTQLSGGRKDTKIAEIRRRARRMLSFRRWAVCAVQHCVPILDRALVVLGSQWAGLVRNTLRRRWRLWLRSSYSATGENGEIDWDLMTERLYRMYESHKRADKAWDTVQMVREDELLTEVIAFVQSVPELCVTVRKDRFRDEFCLVARVPELDPDECQEVAIIEDVCLERARSVFWCPGNLRGFGEGKLYNECFELDALRILLSTGNSEGSRILEQLRVRNISVSGGR